MKKKFPCVLLILMSIITQAQIQLYSDVESIGRPVNSSLNEENVITSSSGKFLYFTRTNHSQNTGGVVDQGDIWLSILSEDSLWSTPIKIPGMINTRGKEKLVGLSGDDELLLFQNNELVSSTSDLGFWSKTSERSVKFLKPWTNNLGASLSAEADYLLLSMESYGSYGVEDIYVSKRERDGNWSTPKNIGNSVNTPYQEITPFLAPDGKTLVFSSNGHHPSQGSFDLYFSIRQDNTWQNWSSPQPLTHLNTPGKDYGFTTTPNSSWAYFVSTQDSDGYGDIKKVRIRPLAIEKDSLITDSILANEKDTIFDFGVFEGAVFRSSFENPIVVSFSFISDVDTIIGRTFIDGRFDAELKLDRPYNLKITKKGYFSKDTIISITDSKKVFHTFFLRKLEVGSTLRLDHVYFKQGEAELLSGSEEQLNEVVKLMEENESLEIKLEGHTDNRGSSVLNLKLSEDRVLNIKDYLVNHGIKKSRIQGEGFGGSKPIAGNSSESSRKKNRRVEFKILKVN